MRDERKVWELMGETSASIYPLAQAIMGAQFEKHFTEQRFYQPTFIAVQRAPKPISAELYSQRNPYANPAGVEQLLADAASAGYIESDGKSGYVASEKGNHAIHTVHSVFYRHINQVDQFSGSPALYVKCAKVDPKHVVATDQSWPDHTSDV